MKKANYCHATTPICQPSEKRMIASLHCGRALEWYVFTESFEGTWTLAWQPGGPGSIPPNFVVDGSLKASTDDPNDLIISEPMFYDTPTNCHGDARTGTLNEHGCELRPTGRETQYHLHWTGHKFALVNTTISEPPCTEATARSGFEMFSNPYLTTGRCYLVTGHIIQWFGPNEALTSLDFSSSGFAVYVDFPETPPKIVLRALVRGEGAYTYYNVLGGIQTVPRVRVIKITGEGAL
ncbi:MAG: hypothetical protein ACLQBA_05560 [Candidatus Binataceae bacterium]